MAQGAISKWEMLGDLLVRIAGPNLDRLQAGLDHGVAAENARSGPTIPGMQPAKKKPGRKKQVAEAAT